MNASPADRAYDVVIIGGALSGAATAILLLREQPGLRVLIIEKSTAFTRRVGEATVEISGYFLCRVLGLTQYLNEAHLVKQGMRFWFCNDRASSLEQCSEIGGRYLALQTAGAGQIWPSRWTAPPSMKKSCAAPGLPALNFGVPLPRNRSH